MGRARAKFLFLGALAPPIGKFRGRFFKSGGASRNHLYYKIPKITISTTSVYDVLCVQSNYIHES